MAKAAPGKYYKDVVLKKLKKYYQKRRPAIGFKHVRLLHDNAPAHTSAIVTAFLKKEKVIVLPHPPYSPDLAPCDYAPTSKKLEGHIASGTFVRACVRPSIHPSVCPSVTLFDA